MPFSSITVKPGVNTVATPTLNVAGISKSNLIRFRSGLPEKMGGWMRYVENAMGSVTRDLHAWQDLSGDKWLGVGSEQSLKIIGNNAINDITPTYSIFNPVISISTSAGSKLITIVDANITANITTFDTVFFNVPISVGGITLTGLYPVAIGGTGTYQIQTDYPATSTVINGGAAPVFATVAGSITVTVTFNNHNLTANSSEFVFPIPTLVGGITIVGSYKVITTPTANTFTITASQAAITTSSATMNGGLAQYIYTFTQDPAGSTYRVGPPGAIGQFPLGEDKSTIIAASNQTGNTRLTTTNWTSDNWGEIYVACPKGGGIYYWSPSTGFTTATLVGTGPAFNNGIFVAMPQQILVAWGSTFGSNSSIGGGLLRQDPLIVRWSDILDFTNWNVTSLTQSGSFHIPNGSEIRGGIQGANQALIWTDIDVWAMQYIGYPLVFGFNSLGSECGLVGPHAAVDIRGVTLWMNQSNFFILDNGGVRVLPCPVWDNVFQDLDTNNTYKCVAAKNTSFNEVMFFYPSLSGGTGENDKYVKVNITEGVWDYGTLPRSAWIDQTILGPPIGADPTTTYLQQHERGYNDDGAAMDSYFETGYFPYGDGENYTFIDHFEPDAKWTTTTGTVSAQLQVTLSAQAFPNTAVISNLTQTMSSSSPYFSPRLRGRQLKWRVESTDLNSWWRWGNTRYRWAIDGRAG